MWLRARIDIQLTIATISYTNAANGGGLPSYSGNDPIVARRDAMRLLELGREVGGVFVAQEGNGFLYVASVA